METLEPKRIRPRQSSLETAEAMYLEAFALKKLKFARECPELSEEELQRKTAEYFSNLPKD